MNASQNNSLHISYFLKVRAGSQFFRLRNNFIETLKSIDWVASVEPMKNMLCFYVDIDAINQMEFESTIQYFAKQLKRKDIGDIIYSRIESVQSIKKKGPSDDRRERKTGSEYSKNAN